MGYYWVRVFDYNYERDQYEKGTLLDEFYLTDIENKGEANKAAASRYLGDTAQKIMFAKPRKKDGLYAIVMESNQFWYDRFQKEIDTYCFWHDCHKQIRGKAADFPRDNLSNKYIDNIFGHEDTIYFCSYECKSHYRNCLNPMSEGEFQEKEAWKNGAVFGYIYLIYNRIEDTYYIGQTRYMPFFRWQEHIKAGEKGDITDLTFSVITEVNKGKHDESDQQYLNNVEAWWIAKYKEEGHKVFNISNPKITIEDMRNKFDDMVKREQQLKIS